MKKRTILFLLFYALGFIGFGFGFGRYIYKRIPDPTFITDTIICIDTSYIPKPVPVITYLPEPPAIIDTAAIIQDYLKAKIYNDTLVANKDITAILKDTIYKNSVLGRTFTYSLSMPVIKQKTAPFSLFLTASTRQTTSLVVIRKRWLFEGGYDFREKTPYLGIGFKLY